MSAFAGHLKTIAETAADYRSGEIAPLSPAHVERWLAQFDKSHWGPLAEEIAHVLKRTYISKRQVEKFLKILVNDPKLTGGNPKSFWKNAHILNVQARGGSQREMLSMLVPVLEKEVGLKLAECGMTSAAAHFVYIDDGLFTGMTILGDLQKWIEKQAPDSANIHVIVMALHSNGQYFVNDKLEKLAATLKKRVTFTWWRIVELENRKYYMNESDVLWPTRIPEDTRTKAYAASLKYEPALRKPGSVGTHKIFSSDSGRDVLEQQLLVKGAYIREICPRLPKFQRPLGNVVLETLGFGSMIVTYRNCPNNVPLAFWAGEPWYPLFPRKTN